MTAPTLEEVESALDSSFSSNVLIQLPYGQAMWTILSAMELIFLNALKKTDYRDKMHIFADEYLNALSHPLRLCHLKYLEEPQDCHKQAVSFEFIDKDCQHACEWLLESINYNKFCSVFPLWRQ